MRSLTREICTALALTILGAWHSQGRVGAQQFEQLSPEVRAFVAVEARHVVIHDVRLIDGTGVPARARMSVVLRDGRIVRVGPTREVGDVPGAQLIDGTGHTLIPGMVMLHEHMFYPSGRARYNTNQFSFPPLYLAGGTTTIRTGGSLDPYTDLSIRREIDAGRYPGPSMDVLMQGDPSEDLDAFRRMTLVFKDGVGYDSVKLFDSVKGWVGVR